MIAIICGAVLVVATVGFWLMAFAFNDGQALAFGTGSLALFLLVVARCNRREQS